MASLFMKFLRNMSLAAYGWGGLAVILFFSTFGLTGGLCLLLYALAFLAGFLATLYYYGKTAAEDWANASAHLTFPPPSPGIPKMVEEVRSGRPALRTDKRMTGSNIIDEVLQEVLDYTYRDYIHMWYKRISDDEAQIRHDVRNTLQRVIIALSERSKQVELVPYFTTRLVDDFASHIRLYRRALEKVREHKKDDTKPPADLESTFFDFETEMENNMCRDMICLSEETERQYLQDLSEVLLFLLLPPEDFHNKPFRYIVREILVNGIFLPTVNLVSDPDYINQTITWLCKDIPLTNEAFLTVIKTSDKADELQAVKEKVDLDVARQRSKDTGGEDDTVIKQQLSSLLFVKTTCEARMQQLKEGVDESDGSMVAGWDLSKLVVPGQRLYALPFDVILNNNVALTYFLDFMTTIGAHGYLFFYLTIEGYRVSAEQQISAALLAENNEERPDLDMLNDAAQGIYTQYLSEQANPRLKFDEDIVKNIYDRLQRREISETIFDQIQARVWDLLQEDPYFPAFRRSQLYIKLLAELDLLKDPSRGDDNGVSDDETASISSKSNSLRTSAEDLASASSCDSLSSAEAGSSVSPFPTTYSLSASITNTGICREHGKAYAVYLITVTKKNSEGGEEVWDVYRRYSDFHDLHMTILERYETVSGLALPSKKAFNNMNKDFLDKRRVGLNAYLQTLLSPTMLANHKGLLELLYQFLEHMVWEREKSQMSRKVETIVHPIKTTARNVGQIVKSMPDNFVDGVAKMSGGFKSIPTNMLGGVGKMLNVKGQQRPDKSGFSLNIFPLTSVFTDIIALLAQPPSAMSPSIKADLLDSAKVGASLEGEDDQDNIPLRIMLLLMDEVFDLKNRNQWLRRRIVAILRQIVKAMMGDSINRKIVDHVEWLTSAEQVAEYLKAFRDSFWPNGVPAEPRPPRDYNTMMRMRVVCKAKMLGSISDELRHLIGSETMRHGVMRIFNMFQEQRLNKRLVYVILEGMLETLFPNNKFPEVFRKMHSRSPRVKKQSPSKSDSKIPGKKNKTSKW